MAKPDLKLTTEQKQRIIWACQSEKASVEKALKQRRDFLPADVIAQYEGQIKSFSEIVEAMKASM